MTINIARKLVEKDTQSNGLRRCLNKMRIFSGECTNDSVLEFGFDFQISIRILSEPELQTSKESRGEPIAKNFICQGVNLVFDTFDGLVNQLELQMRRHNPLVDRLCRSGGCADSFR